MDGRARLRAHLDGGVVGEVLVTLDRGSCGGSIVDECLGDTGGSGAAIGTRSVVPEVHVILLSVLQTEVGTIGDLEGIADLSVLDHGLIDTVGNAGGKVLDAYEVARIVGDQRRLDGDGALLVATVVVAAEIALGDGHVDEATVVVDVTLDGAVERGADLEADVGVVGSHVDGLVALTDDIGECAIDGLAIGYQCVSQADGSTRQALLTLMDLCDGRLALGLLDKGLLGHVAADAVADTNSLDDGGLNDGERLRVLRRIQTRRGAVGGVANLVVLLLGHDDDLGAVGERRGTRDRRSSGLVDVGLGEGYLGDLARSAIAHIHSLDGRRLSDVERTCVFDRLRRGVGAVERVEDLVGQPPGSDGHRGEIQERIVAVDVRGLHRVAALRDGLCGHSAAHTVLDGDGLNSRSLGNSERTRIFGRSVRRDIPVGRIVDVGTLVGRHGHGRGLVEEILRVNGRRSDDHTRILGGKDINGFHLAIGLDRKRRDRLNSVRLRLPGPVVLETADIIFFRQID